MYHELIAGLYAKKENVFEQLNIHSTKYDFDIELTDTQFLFFLYPVLQPRC